MLNSSPDNLDLSSSQISEILHQSLSLTLDKVLKIESSYLHSPEHNFIVNLFDCIDDQVYAEFIRSLPAHVQ